MSIFLKKLTVILFLLLNVHSVGKSQIDTLTNDAIILTLRHQESIHLDTSLAWDNQNALNVAYTVIDSMQFIHSFPDYELRTMSVLVDSSWHIPWLDGDLMTQNHYIDSLSIEYGLEEVYNQNWSIEEYYFFILTFSSHTEMQQLSELYSYHNMLDAHPNHSGGDGDNIDVYHKNDSTYLTFSHGWGDCPAGCIYRYYWMISVGDSSGHLYWEGELISGQIPVWNIRHGRINIYNGYCFALFIDVNDLYDTILNSSKWWERWYAIEVLWRFYLWEWNSPWSHCVQGGTQSLWETMDNELDIRFNESMSVLDSALSDPDLDVVAAAEHAIELIETYYIKIIAGIPSPKNIKLYPAYPNPFNPITTIRYQLPQRSDVQITIYDLRGKEVTTLVSKTQEAGIQSVQWNAANFPSGMYFYQIRAGEYVQTRKMVVLK